MSGQTEKRHFGVRTGWGNVASVKPTARDDKVAFAADKLFDVLKKKKLLQPHY